MQTKEQVLRHLLPGGRKFLLFCLCLRGLLLSSERDAPREVPKRARKWKRCSRFGLRKDRIPLTEAHANLLRHARKDVDGSGIELRFPFWKQAQGALRGKCRLLALSLHHGRVNQ